MGKLTVYQPKYAESWALVIGINEYRNAPTLAHARHDAEAFGDLLKSRFGFSQDRTTVLIDEDASRDSILSAFLRFAEPDVGVDDRVVVYFAGHGYTRSGRRGEIGYLVPANGNPDELSSLIRWDELTRNADLIPAKHLIFLMDACYGGLVLTRSLAAGSARYLKSMLQRFSRQVITSGKADETVADAGGPRPGHSLFTGHLLEGLEEGAVAADGVISANGLMNYVHERVAKDQHSMQTPHFGYLDGDGDFIFAAPSLDSLSGEPEIGEDVLIQIPDAVSLTPLEPNTALINAVKECLADERHRIRLDDLITREVRALIHATSDARFPLQKPSVDAVEFAERLQRYEDAVGRLMPVVILVARWATPSHHVSLQKIVARLAEHIGAQGGLIVWSKLRWYPIMLLMYAGGIAALVSENYRSLAALLLARIGSPLAVNPGSEAVVPTVEGILEVERSDCFKTLPGHERNFAPRSEYLFKALQATLEDTLFLGGSFEDLFDRFEVLYALVYADLARAEVGRVWGPPGRFAWKCRRGQVPNAFDVLHREATQAGSQWPALQAGFFGGSIKRFEDIHHSYREEILSKLNWF